jgi:signal transduction histidine kinase
MERSIKEDDMFGGQIRKINSYQERPANNEDIAEKKLTLLSNFIRETRDVLELHEFMCALFDTFSTVINIDLATYILERESGKVEGKVFSSKSPENSELNEIKELLIERASLYSIDFSEKPLEKLDFIRYDLGGVGSELNISDPERFRTVELPLKCSGNPIGVLSMIFSREKSSEFDFMLLKPVLEYASIGLEKLLTLLSSREKQLESILSSMHEGLFLVDNTGSISVINEKANELITSVCNFGKECLEQGMGAGKCPHGLLETCDVGWLIREIRHASSNFEDGRYFKEITTADNKNIALTVSNLLEGEDKGGFIITARDITEDRIMQKQLFLSSKLVALGEMAAGIAHEVNNPLQVIMGNADLLQVYLKGNDRNLKLVTDLKEGVFKVKSIISNLLDFAREENLATEYIEVNSVVKSAVDIIRGQLGTGGISVELELDERPLIAKCNSNLLQQVILNIIQNAKDAMEESSQGSSIHLFTLGCYEGKVEIVVSDDGPGIAEELIDRIFNPFFTTKDVGKGTGLGLSVSQRIIESMRGSISVTSSKGVNTTFTIILNSESNDKEVECEKVERDADISVLLDKNVLMVDDEESIVDVVKPIITPMVSSFETLTSASKAMARLNDNDYDIILLDIRMPEIDGMELYKWIKENKPYLTERIIFLTGDIESEKTRGFLKLTRVPTLSKPFGTKELINILTSRFK